MRRKSKIFAWLLTFAMVFSLLSNQFMYVVKAEEIIEQPEIAYKNAMAEAQSIEVDGKALEHVHTDSNYITVAMPQCIEPGVTEYVDRIGILLKVEVPACSVIALRIEYTGAISEDTSSISSLTAECFAEGQQTKSMFVSSYSGEVDGAYFSTSTGNILTNDYDFPVEYGIIVTGEAGMAAKFSASSAIAIEDTASQLSLGELQLSETPSLYSVTVPDYDMEGCTEQDYNYGYMYKVVVPEGNKYYLNVTYDGDISTECASGKILYQEEDWINDEPVTKDYYSESGFSISEESGSQIVSLPDGVSYLFLEDSDWSNITIKLCETQNISTLKDTAVVIDEIGSTEANITDEPYTFSQYDNIERGALFKATLQPGQGYIIDTTDQLRDSINYFIYQESGLGSEEEWNVAGEKMAIYNAYKEDITYYIWAVCYDSSATTLPITVSETAFLCDNEATKIVADGTAVNVVNGTEEGIILNEFVDENENYKVYSYYYAGKLYSVDVPANSLYSVKFAYNGEVNIDDYREGLIISILDNNEESYSFIYNEKNDDYDATYKQFAISTIGKEACTYYLLVDERTMKGQLTLTVDDVDNISCLMEDAEDISDKDKVTGLISEDLYTYKNLTGADTAFSYATGVMYKLTLAAGESTSYAITNNSQCGNGVSAMTYTLDKNNNLVSKCCSMDRAYIDNESDEEKTYYVWVYVEENSDITSVTLEKIHNIADLKNTATLIKEGSYNVPVSDAEYMYSKDDTSHGALFKVELKPGEAYTFIGTGDYEDFYYGSIQIYREAYVGQYPMLQKDELATIGNMSEEDQVFYIWIPGVLTGDTYSNITFDAIKLPMVNTVEAKSLKEGDKASIVEPSETLVGCKVYDWIENAVETGEFVNAMPVCGDVYKVELPANSASFLNLDYVGEKLTGWDYEPPVSAKIINSDLEVQDIINVSPYIDFLHGEKEEEDIFHASAALSNSSDEAKSYYVVVDFVEQEGDVEISVTDIPCIDSLMEAAEDVTESATYKGTHDITKYCAPTGVINEICSGKLVKIALKPGTSKKIIFSEYTGAMKYQVSGETLTFLDYYDGSSDLLLNDTSSEVDYYYWVYSCNDDNYYEFTVEKELKIPTPEEPATPPVEEPTPEEPVTPPVEEPTPEEPVTPPVEEPTPKVDVTYHTHIQTLGDTQGTKKNGEMAGTSGMAKRLENIWIDVEGNDNLGIQYTTHCQTYGWMPWSCDGESNGTSGEAKRLEAIMIQLTGADKDKYDVYYRVHAQSYGWLGWAKNGAPAGTAGYGKRLEGIQVVVVKKGEAAPGLKYAGVDGSASKHGKQPYMAKTNGAITIPGNTAAPNVMYKTHVQTYGWQKWMVNGQMSGTSGKSKRLEGINIKLSNAPYDGDIVYTTHVQKYGWKDGKPEDTSRASWKKNGQMSGTSGEAKRLEAICIDLTGEMAERYDVYYRVHAQTYGWLGWAKNGEESGTAGYAKRLEGIQIVLVEKGGKAPANDYGGIKSNDARPFIQK